MTKFRYIRLPLLILALLIFFPSMIAVAGDKDPVLEQTDFWFRDDDGTEISATGYDSPDTADNTSITNIAQNTSFRSRFVIGVSEADGTVTPKLEFKEGTGCTTGVWTAITTTSDIFSLRLSDNFTDGDPTTNQLSGGSFVVGQILESTNPAPLLSLIKNESTEYEWSINATNMPFSTTYSFRVTDNGVALGTYDVCPTLTTTSVTPTPTSGGKRAHTTVNFSGKAFPGAKIFVVDRISEQNTQFETLVNRDTVADTEGAFQVNFIGIAKASHSFGLLIKDRDNRSTQTKFFNIDTLDNELTIKDILVPPTVGIQERLVSRGKPVVVIGNAVPGNKVIVEIDNKVKKEVEVKIGGSYKMSIDTGALEFGTHYVRVKQKDNDQKKESDYSLTNAFVVSRLTEPKVDLSGDGEIDIKDWSMFLSIWGAEDKSQKNSIDLNGDGVVNISDFSVFIKAIRQ